MVAGPRCWAGVSCPACHTCTNTHCTYMFLPATAPNIQCTHVPFHHIPMGGGCPPNHPIHSCPSSSQRRKQRPPNDHCELGASAANARSQETERHCSRDRAQARGPKFNPWQDVCAQDPTSPSSPMWPWAPLSTASSPASLSAHSPAGITQGSAAARFHPLSAAPLGSMKCQRKKVPMSPRHPRSRSQSWV